jgi:cyclic pyranopterin phosphate synthase
MAGNGSAPLIDPFKRRITYLRISVTDRCNLRCRYCMPDIHIRFLPREKVLSFEETETIVRVMARLGVRSLRLTGGEPTVRTGIVELVARLKAIPGIEEVAMTTNGMLLAKLAKPLKAAGLDRINISLDTLKPERFKFITQFGDFQTVWDGILAAEEAGLEPIKLNAVVMRGVNDDEVVDLAALTLEHPWHVRFIEWMPFGEDGAEVYRIDGISNAFMPLTKVKARLEEVFGPLEPAEVQGNGPAKSFKIRGARATIGFIRPITEEHFCARCNKVRLTADGKLRLCLLTDHEIDLMGPLRAGLDEAGLEGLLRAAIQTKPERHLVNEGIIPNLRRMIQIGG